MTNRKIGPVLVGQLLVESGMLDENLLELALERARECGARIGEVLLYSGLISEADLKAALTAQRMVRQLLISFQQAVHALKLVHEKTLDQETALNRARCMHTNEQLHQFSQLLFDAALIDADDLQAAISMAAKSNFPIGRVLMLHGQITFELRKAAVDALILTRCGDITYDHAVAVMKAAARTGHTVRALLGLEASPVAVIGEELVLSGVLTQFEVVDVIEESLQKDKLLWKGQMIASTLVANLKFAASVSLSKLVNSGKLSIHQAHSICQELLISTASVVQDMPIFSSLEEEQLIA
ncbi:MAG: hypothetical protein K2X27_15035 [Candidatus Obscuribacterales bacterium]|nr:hypothetical protein [Candidatus Obscuribacterales bacterium]